jgi:secreted PhoX family phosphatase
MQKLRRRHLLRGGTAALAALWAPSAQASNVRPNLTRDPHGVLDLPPGFSYRVLSRSGEPMSDGYRVPGNPDAMGTFATEGALVLMRNHEVAPGDAGSGPYPQGVSPPKQAYDAAAYGGVTRLVLDPNTLALRSQQLALCGTHWNCAGGLSPWGWLSCEEIFVPQHGYVFLVPHDSSQLTAAQPIRAYGRFRHEAATVDPRTSIAYLTEDREDAAFYRFLPNHPTRPFEGRLQALRVRDAAAFDANQLQLGQHLPIDWVDIERPDSADDDVRLQARARGAARFARTEGLWLSGSELYMCATLGGPIGRGQILRVEHTAEVPSLSVVAQSSDPNVLDMPDNITVSPHGELFVAEDGLEGNYLRRVTRGGEVLEFARNRKSLSEFAGPCFSPDGSTLFVNIQHDGLTLAVRGPFAELAGRPAADGGEPRAPFAGFAGLGAGVAVLAFAALARRKRAAAADQASP